MKRVLLLVMLVSTQARASDTLMPMLTLGVWLKQEAGLIRTTVPSAGLRLESRPFKHVGFELGYRFAYARDGLRSVFVTQTFHALDAKVHWLFPLEWVTLTAGLGPSAYVTTSAAKGMAEQEPTYVYLNGGASASIGAETKIGPLPFRFEVAVAERGIRVDWLANVGVGF